MAYDHASKEPRGDMQKFVIGLETMHAVITSRMLPSDNTQNPPELSHASFFKDCVVTNVCSTDETLEPASTNPMPTAARAVAYLPRMQ